jgi:hypothetical protein
MVLEKPDVVLVQRDRRRQHQQIIYYLSFFVLDAGSLHQSFEQLEGVSLEHVGRRCTVQSFHVVGGHQNLEHEQGAKGFSRATSPID